jgi:predicted metal-dependent phosphoesterase TrpH
MNYNDAAEGALAKIYECTGVDAVFDPKTGEAIPLRVIKEEGVAHEPVGGIVQAAVSQIEIHYMRTDLDRRVVNGETFTIDGTVYTVHSMSPYPGSWTEFEGIASVIEGA